MAFRFVPPVQLGDTKPARLPIAASLTATRKAMSWIKSAACARRQIERVEHRLTGREAEIDAPQCPPMAFASP
jgi:hypothetical protein